MPCQSHPFWLDHTNYVWRGVQVMKLLVMQFPSISRHFISIRSKYIFSCAIKMSSFLMSCLSELNYWYVTVFSFIAEFLNSCTSWTLCSFAHNIILFTVRLWYGACTLNTEWHCLLLRFGCREWCLNSEGQHAFQSRDFYQLQHTSDSLGNVYKQLNVKTEVM
jgi:hypothetical protein